jgi:hypothetical protein
MVADVNSPTSNVDDALEYAFRWTQNISGSWSKKIGSDANNNISVLETRDDGLGLRSTSVGDILMISTVATENGETFNMSAQYEVANFGFDKIKDCD